MDNKATDAEVERLRKSYLEIKKKRETRIFYIPDKLKFPIAWSIFFAVLGIIQQSLVAKKFIFLDFFAGNYVSWFASFGNFTYVYANSGIRQVVLDIIGSWYYFFFTGGLISIIWAILYLIVHSEVKVPRKDLP